MDNFAIFASALQSSKSNLLWPEDAPDHIRKLHSATTLCPSVEIVQIDGATLGGLGLVKVNGDYWFPKGVFPDYTEKSLHRQLTHDDRSVRRLWAGALIDSKPRIIDIDTPVIFPFHPNWIFGHVLIEIIPKLILLDSIFPKHYPILVSGVGKKWLLSMLREIVGDREIITFDHREEVVRAQRIITCSNLYTNSGIHPDCRALFNILRTKVLTRVRGLSSGSSKKVFDPNAPSGVYVSRSRAKVDWHRIENETFLEGIAESYGLKVIHPQEMSFPDQIEAFQSARLIVGEFSSAMHNTVFSAPEAKTLVINCINNYQSHIAIAFHQEIGYVKPKSGWLASGTHGKGFQSISVDASDFENALQMCIRD